MSAEPRSRRPGAHRRMTSGSTPRPHQGADIVHRAGTREKWLVVATATACLALTMLLPGAADRTRSRLMREIASGWKSLAMVSVICAPFIGALVDHMGSRRVAVPGIVVYGVAIAALGLRAARSPTGGHCGCSSPPARSSSRSPWRMA